MKNLLKVTLVVIALFVVTNAQAQLLPISMGIKGGANFSHTNGDGIKTKTGFNAGLTLDINLPANLMIMSGLEVSSKGMKAKDFDLTMNALYLQLPIHLGYKIKLLPGISAHFDLGPYFAQGVGGKTKIKVTSETAPIFSEMFGETITPGTYKENTFSDEMLKKFDWGLGVGVGVTFLGKIGARVGYDHGLANVSNMEGTKIKNRNVYLSGVFKFF